MDGVLSQEEISALLNSDTEADTTVEGVLTSDENSSYDIVFAGEQKSRDFYAGSDFCYLG